MMRFRFDTRRIVPNRLTSKETVQKRKLGNSGLEVSGIGPGCIGMSWSYYEPSDCE